MNEADAPRRVGIVVFTHADYGKALMDSAEGILGAQKAYEVLSVDSGVEVEALLAGLRAAVERLDTGSGVVIFTDMFGGTPTNMSLSLLGSGQLEVLTGVNLPMLIKILVSRTRPLQTLAVEAKQAGCQGIVVAGEVLRKKVAEG